MSSSILSEFHCFADAIPLRFHHSENRVTIIGILWLSEGKAMGHIHGLIKLVWYTLFLMPDSYKSTCHSASQKISLLILRYDNFRNDGDPVSPQWLSVSYSPYNEV